MNSNKRWFYVVLGSGLLALILVGVLAVGPTLAQGPGWWRMGPGMMGGYGPGWMMGATQGYTGTVPYGYGPGWMGGGFHHGMMGGYGPGARGGYGPGWMMGGYGPGMMGRSGLFNNPDPLTVEEASAAVESFLANLNNSNLALGEIMIFDNQAYAQIMEKDTGTGAMEVLVDPVSQAVYPEMGPNMMWNLKYGMHSFGYAGSSQAEAATAMPVSSEEAAQTAQSYLDTYLPASSLQVTDEITPFYGYYTIDVSRNGKIAGMLSVNGYTGQVFLHTWHGNFVEMSEE